MNIDQKTSFSFWRNWKMGPRHLATTPKDTVIIRNFRSCWVISNNTPRPVLWFSPNGPSRIKYWCKDQEVSSRSIFWDIVLDSTMLYILTTQDVVCHKINILDQRFTFREIPFLDRILQNSKKCLKFRLYITHFIQDYLNVVGLLIFETLCLGKL